MACLRTTGGFSASNPVQFIPKCSLSAQWHQLKASKFLRHDPRQPIFGAIDWTAAHVEEYSSRGSLTKRTARSLYSDSILVTGSSLAPVLQAAQGLSFFCLAHNFLLRGGIAYGRYWEQRSGEHLLVVSDALIKAVKLEQMVGVPVVVLADDIEIPEFLWLKRFDGDGPFATPLLHFRDRNIVNPFNIFWGTSAAHRARLLMEASPAHSNKYLWFLALYEALVNQSALVPEHIFNSFVQRRMIGPPERTAET